MYSFVVVNSSWRRETIRVSALDDQDAIRLANLYFESDLQLRWLEIVSPEGAPLTALLRGEHPVNVSR